MKQKQRRGCLSILVTLIGTLLMIDGLLWWVDPVGVVAYHADFNALQALSLPALDGYRYTPGTHCFRKYCVTIGDDGLRVVSETAASDCDILFVGDSVTFGMGANRSYVDVLAPGLDATVRNGGLPGYSAANVAAMVDAIPADGYIWLIIENDAAPLYVWERPSGRLPSAMTLYLGWLFPGNTVLAHEEALFSQVAAPLLARPDVLAFAFLDVPLTTEAAAMGAHIIPFYRSYVSRYDAHPSDLGSAEIAAQVQDRVSQFVEARCAASVTDA